MRNGVAWFGSTLADRRLPGATKGEIETTRAQQRVLGWFERHHTVVTESVRTAPDHDIAVEKLDAAGFVAALEAAEQEYGGNAERDRDDGLGEILFVGVAVKGESRNPGGIGGQQRPVSGSILLYR